MDDGNLTGLQEAVRLLQVLEERFPDPAGQVRSVWHRDRLDVVLDHPAARHALSAKMMRELATLVLEAARAGPAWVVLRSSDPRAFCAGGNLDQVRNGLLEPAAAVAMTRAMTAVTRALWAMPSVTIALVEGPAIGGGAELAISCDLRFLSRSAWVQPAQARLGVVNGWGGAEGWRRVLGYPGALRVLLEAERLDAATCASLGIASFVGDREGDQLLADGLGSMAERDRAVVHAMKEQLRDPIAAAEAAFLGVWGGQVHRANLGLG